MTELPALDPIDLPDWLGTESVTWHARGADRTGFTADRVVEVLARLARSVGARPENYVVAQRLGVVRGDRGTGG